MIGYSRPLKKEDCAALRASLDEALILDGDFRDSEMMVKLRDCNSVLDKGMMKLMVKGELK
jgi:hypothetical protein